jgi:hypothetical protein
MMIWMPPLRKSGLRLPKKLLADCGVLIAYLGLMATRSGGAAVPSLFLKDVVICKVSLVLVSAS